ncbi:hypothetical protein Unana1_03128 [Umbelopsis nana]
MIAEKRALKVVYDRVFAAHFANSDTSNNIEKPPFCPSQIRAFNARKFIANFKQQKHTHFFKFQYDTIKAQVLSHLPAELKAKLKHGYAKKITFALFRKINQLDFVSNLERYRSEANSNAGILTDLLWDEAVSSIAETNQVGPQREILQGVVIDEDDQQEAKEQEEDDDPFEINDDESDDDESDDDEDTEAVERRITAGERLAAVYMSQEDQNDIITSHRRALGILLLVPTSRYRRMRRLGKKLLKDSDSNLAAILAYQKFLRVIRARLNSRRFQLFPESKMVTKYFNIDQIVLEKLCEVQVKKTPKGNPSFQEIEPATAMPEDDPSDLDNYSSNIWERVFNFQSIAKFQITLVSVLMDMAVVSQLVEDDVGDPHRTIMLAKEEKKDISASKKGQFPLQKITPENLSTIMNGSNPIGVDPGLKSLVTSVRSNNPADNVQITAGMKMASLENARLTRAFERKEHGVRLRSQIVDRLTTLSTLPRDNYDEWVTYIHHREIRIESAMAGMKNAILSPQSSLPPIKPVAATGPVPLDLHTKNRICLRSSLGDDDSLQYSHPVQDCRDLRGEPELLVIRHRMCTHCDDNYANGFLENQALPWTMYLANICQRRFFDHMAVWRKDVMAAFNMRRIVQHYAETGTPRAWNLPDMHRVL